MTGWMRVGLFTNNYLPFRGGVSTAVETVRVGLEGLGHHAWVFAPAPHPPSPDRGGVFRYPSVPAPTYPGFALPWPYSRRLAARASALALDVYHAQHPFLLGPAARRLARRARRPLVFTYHTRYEKYAHYVPLPERFIAALAIRLSCRFAASADLVIAPSAVIADFLRSREVGTEVAVVPTGVPLGEFCPGDRERSRAALGLDAGDLLCLYVGRLDREKNVERVIEAFGQIAGALRPARLFLVGQGSHAAALEAAAESSPARARIHFHGSVPRSALPPVYRAADLFLFASETETQGLVLAEAHACGLPVVAVRASGVEEVVRDGETGLLTKADAGELAAAAIGLLLDPARREAMSRAARRHAEGSFSAEGQVRLLETHYRRLLRG
ncbi:MAG: glycosyltransferase [Candidatus Rokubacteria bacterium]|nr:glycosyltransferase [Candidatus Rokubacteria bacterium]